MLICRCLVRTNGATIGHRQFRQVVELTERSKGPFYVAVLTDVLLVEMHSFRVRYTKVFIHHYKWQFQAEYVAVKHVNP